MKHYFFVNPAAGQGKGLDKLLGEIEEVCGKLGQEKEIYITKAVGDGEEQARKIAASLNGAAARFYACGGDGTCNEIVNGAVGYPNIAVGCIPAGTGNDTVRSVPGAGDFRSVRAQVLGETMDVDVIRYSGVIDGTQQTRYCINMFNIGLDCNVAALAAKLKKKPLIAGSMAYLLAVVSVFIQKKTIGLRLAADGAPLLDGDVLVCAISNGCYCGGGMYTAPMSSIEDGVFEVNLIGNISRLKFLQLFPKYKAGTHMEMPGIEKIIQVRSSKSLKLEAKNGPFPLCTDGEISQAETVEFEIIPGGLPFVVPAK